MENARNVTLELTAARSHRWHAGGVGSRLIDKEFLESTLDLGNRAWVDGLLRVAHGG